MADAPFVIESVATYQDELRDYLPAEFNARDEEFKRAFGGGITIYPPSEKVKPGKVVEQPRLAEIGALTRLDLTNTSAVSSTAAPSSKRGRGPVRSSYMVPKEFFDHAIRGYEWSKDQIAGELARQMSNRAINYRKKSMYKAFRGALAAMSTTHTNDETGETTKTLQVSDVFDTKALCGDAAGALNTLIIHSKQANSLLKNLVTGGNFQIFQVGDRSVQAGVVPQLGGLRVIIDDDVETATSGSNTNYYGLLLGPGAGWLAPATDTPKYAILPNLDKGVLAWKEALEDHFAVGVSFSDMDTNYTNPTDANMILSTNWSDALSHDHRDFKLACVITQDG